MEFREIERCEYDKFWENHPLKTFLSSSKIGDLREKSNWKKYFVGVFEKDSLVGAAMLVSHVRKFGRHEFYSPRGFLIDFSNKELLNFFLSEIRKFVKSHGGYILRIDPYVINKERDINGDIVEGGVDNSNVVKSLESFGFKRVDKQSMEQVGWMFSLGLENKTKEEITKGMSATVRNTIRKTEKIDINIRELKYEELNQFMSIMEETGKRKGFSVRKIDYFQEMYKLFHDSGEVKYFISELDLDKYILRIENDKKERLEKIKKLGDKGYNKGQVNALNDEVRSMDKKLDEARGIIKNTGKNVITLSGSMFMLIKPEIIYLSSGNYEEYMQFNSQYLIQWKLIQYGIENGFKKHNFYGIPADINTKPKDYGIYEFKKGFNGYVEELIGEFELPITWHYYLFKFIHKLRGRK